MLLSTGRLLSLFRTQRLDKAYSLGKDLEAHTQSANDFSFNCYMGIVCYYLAQEWRYRALPEPL